MTDLADATAAGILIGAGFTNRNPAEGSDYGHALDRYRNNQQFRELVDEFARGLGLTILGTPRSGVVLAPVVGSPFAFRLGDLRMDNTEARMLFGLAMLAIAALAYPRDDTLDTPGGQILSIKRVEQFVRTSIEPLKALTGDADTVEARVRSAALAWDRLPVFKPKASQPGPATGCTQRIVQDGFELLVDQHMANRAGARLGEGRYLLTDRFRLMVAEIAGGEALEALRRVANERGSEFAEG
jgi:hypothetical protein